VNALAAPFSRPRMQRVALGRPIEQLGRRRAPQNQPAILDSSQRHDATGAKVECIGHPCQRPGVEQGDHQPLTPASGGIRHGQGQAIVERPDKRSMLTSEKQGIRPLPTKGALRQE
jgi:hypothetical protein